MNHNFTHDDIQTVLFGSLSFLNSCERTFPTDILCALSCDYLQFKCMWGRVQYIMLLPQEKRQHHEMINYKILDQLERKYTWQQ